MQLPLPNGYPVIPAEIHGVRYDDAVVGTSDRINEQPAVELVSDQLASSTHLEKKQSALGFHDPLGAVRLPSSTLDAA